MPAAHATTNFVSLMKSMRIELPHFNGSRVNTSAIKAEEYFTFHETLQCQELCIASFHLKGTTVGVFKKISFSLYKLALGYLNMKNYIANFLSLFSKGLSWIIKQPLKT